MSCFIQPVKYEKRFCGASPLKKRQSAIMSENHFTRIYCDIPTKLTSQKKNALYFSKIMAESQGLENSSSQAAIFKIAKCRLTRLHLECPETDLTSVVFQTCKGKCDAYRPCVECVLFDVGEYQDTCEENCGHMTINQTSVVEGEFSVQRW